MPDEKYVDQLGSRISRRLLLCGGAAAMSTLALAPSGAAARVSKRTNEAMTSDVEVSAVADVPVPPAVLSRQDLETRAGLQLQVLPLARNGTTYAMAQEVTWLDQNHFAVGRWDGTLSIFEFDDAPFTGPMINEVVNTPALRGVQMVTSLPEGALASSNDASSISVWASPLRADGPQRVETYPYDSSLGVATNGAWLAAGKPSTLVVGHDSGFLSIWAYSSKTSALRLIRTVDVRNPDPVNPWDFHAIYGMATLVPEGPHAAVVAGSDDGFISIVHVPSGRILSQKVFNPKAQRGINSVSVLQNKLLVANCSVGPDDHNLWYFSVDMTTWQLNLLDRVNLIVDPREIQVFNFDVVWGRYAQGDCWFASTEEGMLWMGSADTGLHVIGSQSLGGAALGSAIAYRPGPGRLVAVSNDLNEFTTGS